MEEMAFSAKGTSAAGQSPAQITPNNVRWKDLRGWIELIEKAGLLKRIQASVALEEELSAITFMATRSEDAPALLFENLDGAAPGMTVLANMLGASAARYAIAMGLDQNLSTGGMIAATRHIMRRRFPPRIIAKSSASVNENVLTGSDIDVTRFPAPKFWPGDGGRYIGTGDITLTRDPATRRINVGCYRQMVQSRDRVSLYCSPGKHGRLDREAWWQRGESCEVVAAYGVDPVLFMVSAQVFGAGDSEFDTAGGIMGSGLELTQAEFVDLPIPAHCEIAIEGVLHPGEFLPEGPLGEFTGYYGGTPGPQPVIEIKAVHHRRDPILTAALMATYPSCEIGAYYAIMRSARIWDDLETIGVPGIAGVYAHPAAASGWGMVVVSLRQLYAGHVAQVLALTAQCPAAAYYTKWVIAVDDDVDPTDFNQVMWALSTRCNPSDDIDLLRKTWSTGLDPSKVVVAERPYGSKALIDACKPHRYLDQFPKRTLLRRPVYEQVAQRWGELGLEGAPPTLTDFHGE
jgi:4-hydroxy-3-polyprenylbenzoate decarboxylase